MKPLKFGLWVVIVTFLMLEGLTAVANVLVEKKRSLRGFTQHGLASYYSVGQRTASGEHFDPTEMTAAHRTLPFGTVVKVRNLQNGKTVQVRINDRGPYTKGRIIDISKTAADRLGLKKDGLVPVEIQVVKYIQWEPLKTRNGKEVR